jgi:3-deoxy-manno-octulosonate cytidylyltransferase (CMP-KDO synthetase)
MNPSTKIVIPARYSSSRLPGKPLLDIGGKPMIEHVYLRALETGADADNVIIATDDARIEAVVKSFGGQVVMTAPDHPSGSDRLAEVATNFGWSDDVIVVNLQGDEPLMDPKLITLVADNLISNKELGLSTLATGIHSASDIYNPNVVKVVCDKNGRALYFSRAAIPWVRGAFDYQAEPQLPENITVFRHLGMYAYRVGVLKALTAQPACALEEAESLEQLRALWLGIGIHVGQIDAAPGHGVDTAEDLERVRAELLKQ